MNKQVFYNLLIAGDTATGKTEFIETYLNLKCAKYEPQVLREIRQAREEQLMFVHHKIQRVEKSLEFHLNIIDTPGYGKFPTIHYWLRSLRSFIKQQAQAYHHQKKLKKRDEREDTRIHLCLYFMDGPRCKESDIAILKALQKYVNILPILSKADTYTTPELRQVKFEMADELYRAGVEFFESGRWEGSLGPCPPFAVICAANPICVSPQLYIYGRKYPWGVCDLNNPNHSDFALLCKLLIGHFFQPAVESTKDKAHFMISKYKQKLKLQKQRKKDRKKLTEKKKTLLHFIANVAQAASNMLIR